MPRTDADRIRFLADWFDLRDAALDLPSSEVQDDLRRIAKRLDALDEVERAIHDPGPRPDYHRLVKQRHRKEWPALWKGLDRLRGLQSPRNAGRPPRA